MCEKKIQTAGRADPLAANEGLSSAPVEDTVRERVITLLSPGPPASSRGDVLLSPPLLSSPSQPRGIATANPLASWLGGH